MSNYYSFGLVGFPLEHTFSPYIHTRALSACGLEGEYVLYPVPPLPNGTSEICNLLANIRKKEIAGLNVTIPYKRAVIPFLDELTSEANHVKAVNTIYTRNGKLIGDNTDIYGFLTDLNRKLVEAYNLNLLRSSIDQHALVLGAGGAARAIVYGLLLSCWKVTVAARSEHQAAELVIDLKQNISNDYLNSIPLNKISIGSLLSEIILVINATPVGMWSETQASPWPEGLMLSKGMMVYDLVYNPQVTQLIQQAHTQGLYTSGGLGMLVEQAILSFIKWTGCIPDKNSFYENMIDNLSKEIPFSGEK